VNGTSESIIALKSGGVGKAIFFATNAAAYLQTESIPLFLTATGANYIALQTNGVVRATVGSDGKIDTQGNPITNCPTTAKAWSFVSGIVNTNGASQTFLGNNVASIVRGATAGLYTITLTSGTFSGSVVISAISATNNAGARVVTYSGNMCLIQTYVGATATDMAFNMVYFSN
jgi:hypothetical protein